MYHTIHFVQTAMENKRNISSLPITGILKNLICLGIRSDLDVYLHDYFLFIKTHKMNEDGEVFLI